MRLPLALLLLTVLLHACTGKTENATDQGSDNNSPDIESSQNISFEDLFLKAFLSKTTNDIEGTLKYLADKDLGVYLIYREGGIRNIKMIEADNIEELSVYFPFSDAVADLSCKLSKAGLPTFDCTNEFSSTGCFVDDFQSESFVSDQRNSAVADYTIDSEDIPETRATKADDTITTKVILTTTSPAMALYFGQVNNNWRLIALDASSYICE